MLHLQDFLRATPAALLRGYFQRTSIAVDTIDWHAPPLSLATTLLHAVDGVDERVRLRIMDDADRISIMAREDGEAAIFDVVRDPRALEALENSHARATWMFVHDPNGFERAENVRNTDKRRFGRMWVGFAGPAAMQVARNGPAVDAFKVAAAAAFRSEHVDVEICDRTRASFGRGRSRLVQVAIFLEGRRGSRRAFLDGRLSRVPDRPVLEAAICYDATSGAIEVFAAASEWRDTLARLFAEHLLGGAAAGGRLPLREYRLDRLRQAHDFPTEAGDGIERVDVIRLRLMPLDTHAERVTLECMRGFNRTIWATAEERFGDNNPLLHGYRVTQVRLRIRLVAQPGRRGPRTLPVTITMPHGCDLKDQVAIQRLVAEKYLVRWGLVRDL